MTRRAVFNAYVFRITAVLHPYIHATAREMTPC